MSDETTPRSDDAAATAATPESTTTEAVKADDKTPAAPWVGPRDWVFLAVIAVLSAVADLWSKAWALGALSRASNAPPPLCSPPPGMQHYLPQRVPTREVVLIKDYLDFQYAENCGGAWGLLHGTSEAIRRPFFLLVTIGAIFFILHLYRSLERGQVLMKWALPLVLGGAVGNLVDRFRLGYVVDFIHAHWKLRYHWPTFNVADIAITVGIGLMLLEYVIGPRRAAKPVAEATSATT